jgi:23S rRNA (guanosine2251-2'-O)-methyltransferase
MSKIQASTHWLYGIHAVEAAWCNPKRRCLRLLTSEAHLAKRLMAQMPRKIEISETNTRGLEARLGDVVHQGIALEVEALPEQYLEPFLEEHKATDPLTLAVLDHIIDPHNVGAILRSATAFGVHGLIITQDHTAPLTGVVAKSACGALDKIPIITVVNLAQSLRILKAAHIWCVGLAADAPQSLMQLPDFGRVAYVFGAEGKGLRPNTQKQLDTTASIPMAKGMESLNVSNAAAITLYQRFVHNPKSHF